MPGPLRSEAGRPLEAGRRPLIGDVIDSLGFGWAQVQLLFLGGGVWLADGAEVLLIGSVTRSLARDWDLNAAERGFVVSVVFVGVLLGNGVSGSLGDRYGRRIPILLSYSTIVLFSLLSAVSTGYWSLVLFRSLVGMAFGVGQPTWLVLSSEMSPTTWRVQMSAFSQILFAVGELYSAALVWMDDPKMKDLHWRVLLAVGALPSLLIGLVAMYKLEESPTFLSSKRRNGDAYKTLTRLRAQNGRDDVPVEFTAAALSDDVPLTHGLRVVFGRHLAFTTLVTGFTCFSVNFLYYGGLYAFPQVLPELNLRFSSAANLFLGAAFEIPGFLLGMALGDRMTRKNSMILSMLATLISVALFLYGTGYRGVGVHTWAIMVGYLGLKAFVNTTFVLVYLYSCEVYPLVVRATGSAVCLLSGRIGAIACPLLYELMTEASGTYHTYFVLLGALCVIDAFMVSLLTIETSGKRLEDVHEADLLLEMTK